MTFRSKALRDLCRGRACACCGIRDETVIPAHRNKGKGMGIKSTDATVAPLCFGCHMDYDSGKWHDADLRFAEMALTHLAELIEEGALVIAGHRPTARQPKPLAKIVRHAGYRR